MSVTLGEARLHSNHLLAKLSDEHLASICPMLKQISLKPKDVLHNQNASIPYVYFPSTSALSNLLFLNDGSAVEVGTVGNEGFSAVELLAGASVSTETCICQIAGESLHMAADDFRTAVEGSTPLGTCQTAICRATWLSFPNRWHATANTRWKRDLHVGYCSPMTGYREKNFYLPKSFWPTCWACSGPALASWRQLSRKWASFTIPVAK